MFLRVSFLIFCSILSADLSISSQIPLFIWQTYKTTKLPKTAFDAHQTWVDLNPEFSHFLHDDGEIEKYIEENWPSDFLQFFHALPIGAMKADLWRYLILASEGGVYSDIDSLCLKPIREWSLKEPLLYPHILLIDLDCDHSQFCQWTFAATPKHPLMYYICYHVLERWRQRKGFAMSRDGKINVLATTGPIIFSDAIKRYIGEPSRMEASTILKKYNSDEAYREKLNRLGVFFTEKGFFSGVATQNLFWGTWAHRVRD
jgi:mannosyltransferase OCH1-like enzyme